MAFDLSTARPVEAADEAPRKGKFDLSTARPVGDQPSQSERKPKSDSFVKDTRDVAGEYSASVNGALMWVPDTAAKALDKIIGGYSGLSVLATGGSVDEAVASVNKQRIPTPSDVIEGATGHRPGQGDFMEPGLARDAVKAAGQTTAIATGGGALLRNAAARLPAATAGEGVGRGVVREMARATAAQDAVAGGLAGIGAEVGEELGGEEGRLVGSVLAPMAAAPISAVRSAATRSSRGVIPNDKAALIEEGKNAGIPMLTSDVLPPKTFPGKAVQQTAEKIPVVGTAPVRQGQQQMREKAVADIADKYGEYSYDAIITSLKNQKDRIKRAAGAVLQSAGEKLDTVGTIPTRNTAAAISRAEQELKKEGVIQSASASDDLNKLITALGTPQSFTTLKENRTAFREIVNSTDKAERSQLTSRAKALLDDVYHSMTKDMDEFASSNLPPQQFSRWKKANEVYAGQARTLTRSKLKNVLDKGDITPESVKQMLFSQNSSEQRLLYNSLTNEGRANARSAIISKIINDLSRRSSGVSPNSFASELKKYGAQVDVFFKGGDKRQLVGLGRVLEATRRAQDAAVTTPTGQQLIGGLSVTGLYLDPIATVGTAGTLGGLARIYESAPVRNALLRLGSVPQGSDKYAQALLNAQIAVNAAVQQESGQSAGTE